MSAEFMAHRLLELIADNTPDDDRAVDVWPEENVRSGGYWFTFTYRGKHYEAEVTEVTSR